MTTKDLVSNHHVKLAFSWTPWNDPMVGPLILPVAFCFERRREQRLEHTIVVHKYCIKVIMFVESLISQKYEQLVPTSQTSILHASWPSHLPYMHSPANTRNIPTYTSIYICTSYINSPSTALAAAILIFPRMRCPYQCISVSLVVVWHVVWCPPAQYYRVRYGWVL